MTAVIQHSHRQCGAARPGIHPRLDPGDLLLLCVPRPSPVTTIFASFCVFSGLPKPDETPGGVGNRSLIIKHFRNQTGRRRPVFDFSSSSSSVEAFPAAYSAPLLAPVQAVLFTHPTAQKFPFSHLCALVCTSVRAR